MVFKMIEEANLIEKRKINSILLAGNKREMLFFSGCNCGIDERG
jgi:type IV secretory pathway TrbD component